jgi:Na+-driven multidrug efflux pump
LTRPVMDIAIPNSGDLLSHSIYQVAIVMVAIRVSDEAVACHTYLRQVIVVVMLWAYSIGQGQAIWTAHLVGAREFDKAEFEIRKSIVRSLAFTLPVTFLLYLFIDPIIRLFTDNPDIVVMAGSAMIAYLGIELGRGFNTSLSFSLSSAGHAKYPALLAVIFNWFVGLLTAYVLGIYFGWGLLGILIGLAMDELARAPLLYRRLRSRRWIPAQN